MTFAIVSPWMPSPVDAAPDDDHRIELTLLRSGDRLSGFLLANPRTARGKFEVPVPVSLRRKS